MNIFDDLRNIVSTVGQNLQLAKTQPKQFGKGLTLGFNQIQQNIGKNKTARNLITTAANITDFPAKRIAQPFLSQTIAPYANTHIAKPLIRAGNAFRSNEKVLPSKQGFGKAVNTLLPAVQAGFGLTPTGLVYNNVVGAVGGGIKGARQGQSPIAGAIRGAQQGEYISSGLGIKNPYAAIAVDFLSGNPRGLLKQAGKITTAKGLFGKAATPKVHPGDVYEFDRAVDVLRNRKKSTPEALAQAHKTIYNLAEGYLDPKTLGKKLDNTNPNKIISELRKVVKDKSYHSSYSIPGMGLVDDSKASAKVGKVEQPKVDLKQTQGLMQPKLKLRQPNSSSLSSNGSSGGILTQSGKLPIEEQRLNVNNLNLDETQKLHVQSLEDATKIRTKLGDKQVLEIADKAGLDTKTYTIDETAQKIAEQLNNRRNVVSLENQLSTLRKGGASEDEVASVIKQIAESSRIATEQGTDIARQLSARRILANDLDTPMQRIFKLLEKAGINPEVYAKKAATVDFNDAKQVVDFYRSLVPASKTEWVDAVRYNSMLSSPLTHIVNITSNFQGTGLITPIEKTLTGSIDWLKASVTGKPRQYAVGEGLEYAKGYYSNLRTATQKFFRSISGKDLTIHPDMRHIPLGTKGAAGVAEKTLNLPGRLLEGMDQFFTTLTEGGLNRSLTYRQSKGITVNNLANQVPDEAATRLFRSSLGNPREGHLLNAIDTLPSKIIEITHSQNPVARTIARLSFPFVRVGTNLIKQGIEYGPTGIATIPGALEKTPQVAKAVLGTGIMFGTAMLASSDRTTFKEPTGAKEKQAFRAAGKIPYAVKIGDNWVSYNKLHPAFAFNMALVSAMHEAQKKNALTDDQTGTIAEAIFDSVNFWADQSYFKNIGDMVSGLRGGENAFVRLVGNYPAQLIPFRALMSWVERIVDPYQRQVDPNGDILKKQMQQIYSQIPGLANQVPVRTDAQGNPIKNQHQIINAISPARVSTENKEGAIRYDILKEQQQVATLKERISTGEVTLEQANALIAKQRPGFGIDTAPQQPRDPRTTEQLQATAFGKQFSTGGGGTRKLKLSGTRRRKGRRVGKLKVKKLKMASLKIKKTKGPKIARLKLKQPKKFKIKSLKSYT